MGSSILRGRAEVAQRAHNPKVAGSNPAPATNLKINYLKTDDLQVID